MTTQTGQTGPAGQASMAARLLALHSGPDLLVIPNAWDVITARLFEVEGFAAIATSSAAIAAAIGHPDGQRMTLVDNLAVVRRIAARVAVPVSADLEAGYAPDAPGVIDACRAAVAAGAAGVNLEDGTGEPGRPLADADAQAGMLRAIRRALDHERSHLVINARTDAWLVPSLDARTRLDETLRRARAYRAAGADCIFVPDTGLLDETTIAILVRKIDAPLNLIAGPHLPPLPRLRALGVARVSLGPRPARAALGLVRRIARELRETGTCVAMTEGAIPYAEVNDLLARPSQDHPTPISPGSAP